MEPIEFIYKKFVRALIWKLDPDTAHQIGQEFYKQFKFLFYLGKEYCDVKDPRLKTRLGNRKLSTPIILEAGEDKNGDLIESHTYSGFRNQTIGSVRPYEFDGNTRPWCDRDKRGEKFWNSMGIPSKGKSYVLGRMTEMISKFDYVTFIINYAGRTPEEILELDKEFNKIAHIRVINASCPNTNDGKFFEQNPELLKEILGELNKQRKMPTFVKVSPYNLPEQKEQLTKLVKVIHDSNAGIVNGNTKIDKSAKFPSRFCGLSGPLLYEGTRKTTEFIYRLTEGEMDIIAAGGIEYGYHVYELIGLGANAVGFVTAKYRRGPTVVRNMSLELINELNRSPYHSVEELRGKLLHQII